MKYSEVTEVIRWYPQQFSDITDKDIWGKKRRIDMYVHIPFCLGKCAFCPFNSVPINNQNLDTYFDALLKEIDMYSKESYFSNTEISALWIGGGTPSAIPFERIETLLHFIEARFRFADDAEITLESNLHDLTENYIQQVSSSKITRLSIGIQSFLPKYLKMGGRTYTIDDIDKFFSFIRNYKIDVSIDLMYRYPGQTVEEVDEEIDEILKRIEYIDHITLYSLILFPRLGMYKRIIDGKLPKQCNFDNYTKMNTLLDKRLTDAGFNHYTSYHYSRPGKECKYNIDRWGFPQLECVAMGPGAFGQINGYVYCNEHKTENYFEKINAGSKPIQQGKYITLAEQISRYMVLGTKCRTIDMHLFSRLTGVNLLEFYKEEINTLIENDLVEIREDVLYVTPKGCTYIIDVNKIFQTENNIKFTQPQYYILDMMDVQSNHKMSEVIEDGDEE